MAEAPSSRRSTRRSARVRTLFCRHLNSVNKKASAPAPEPPRSAAQHEPLETRWKTSAGGGGRRKHLMLATDTDVVLGWSDSHQCAPNTSSNGHGHQGVDQHRCDTDSIENVDAVLSFAPHHSTALKPFFRRHAPTTRDREEAGPPFATQNLRADSKIRIDSLTDMASPLGIAALSRPQFAQGYRTTVSHQRHQRRGMPFIALTIGRIARPPIAARLAWCPDQQPRNGWRSAWRPDRRVAASWSRFAVLVTCIVTLLHDKRLLATSAAPVRGGATFLLVHPSKIAEASVDSALKCWSDYLPYRDFLLAPAAPHLLSSVPLSSSLFLLVTNPSVVHAAAKKKK